jgi:mRNA-degrading endonuclease RelE of RelBE toxin-antitoxin system
MTYTIRVSDHARKQAFTEGITVQELREIIAKLNEIADRILPSQRTDDVMPICQTKYQWSRIKDNGHSWRVIVEFQDKHEIIDVEMIIRRTDDTYCRVETRWRELNRRVA